MVSSFPLDFTNFELEITDRCNLACPRCARTELLEKFPKIKFENDLDLGDFKRFIAPELVNVNIFEFKGTLGDPIFHPKFIDWIKWVKSENKRAFIHTNGQAGKSLWNKLAPLLTKDDQVVLGIDGMPDDFMQYRVNGKWKNIEATVTALKGKCHLVWQFIVFSYNEHEIEEARALSVKMGFDEFLLYHSDRWRDGEDTLKPTLENASLVRGRMDSSTIDPDCLSRPMHIITADGYYMPCCYLTDPRWRYKTAWAKAFKISDNLITDVIKSSIGDSFYANLNNEDAPSYCRFECGKCK